MGRGSKLECSARIIGERLCVSKQQAWTKYKKFTLYTYLRRVVKKFPEFPWLKKCDNWSIVIEEWLSWSWNRTPASLTNPFMRFCPAIWRWDLSVRSLFRAVSASRWRTEPHIACCAAIPRREKHSCHHPTTVLSVSRSEWLSAVSYSENVLQGDAFRTMEDIESNATADLRKIPKEAFRQCIQQSQDRWGKCVCVQGSDFEGDWVSVVICPTIKVLYHNSGSLWLPLIYN